MLIRVLAICLGLFAFAMLSMPAVAEDKDSAHEGTVVKAGDGKLTTKDKDGRNILTPSQTKPRLLVTAKSARLMTSRRAQRSR